ncbi:MAG: hypothetical protein A3K19_19525 [Lentisphaerae bacterium RIFOXYB12_FULL_65_16]|nr:MAG: hypothetical protein A3K18_31290 [Lentisphaerae bacterium RIFOXYA12_64_32]OGV92053.1 MAG: hypothetical protein A3K19_19525 [Lentisphaerae bacterium RIFOXYB12_FULL_65_16]
MRTWVPSWILLLAATALIGVSAGCRTAGSRQEASPVLGHTPVLVLLPLADRTDNTAECCRQFGEYLYQEFSNRSAAQAVRAEQVSSLSGTVTPENLIRSGLFALEETAALGRLAQCGSVVATQVLEFRPYPPQLLALKIVWVDADSGQLLNRVHLRVDLADPRTRDDFKRFVDQDASAVSLIHSPEPSRSYLETALLSPRLFHRFTAQRAAQALIVPSTVAAMATPPYSHGASEEAGAKTVPQLK